MSISIGKQHPVGGPVPKDGPSTSATRNTAATAATSSTRDGFKGAGEREAHAQPLASAPVVSTAGNVYTVAKGDTATGIAGKFGLTVDQLAKANTGVDPAKLAIGQKLTLPGRAIATVTTATTLEAVAKQYGCDPQQVSTANGFDTKTALQPGAQLWLADATLYSVKATDTLASIAKHFHTTPQAVAHANGLDATKPIKVGQKLAIVPGKAVDPGKHLKEPTLMKEHRTEWGYTFDQKGKLFINGVSSDDIEQGQAGDCYFLSAISSVAHSHPEVLQKAIHDNGDGTVTVTFHEQKWIENTKAGTWSQVFKPVKVTVDKQLPGQNGYMLYAQEGRSGHEEWVPLLEKAYAQWKGGYEQIGEGGWPATTLSELTGKQSQPITVQQPRPQLYTQLHQLIAHGGALCACSKLDSPVLKKNGIIGCHAYSLVGVTTQHGERFVQLRNPWGNTEFGHDGKNDGTFLMPLARFQQCFNQVDGVA